MHFSAAGSALLSDDPHFFCLLSLFLANLWSLTRHHYALPALSVCSISTDARSLKYQVANNSGPSLPHPQAGTGRLSSPHPPPKSAFLSHFPAYFYTIPPPPPPNPSAKPCTRAFHTQILSLHVMEVRYSHSEPALQSIAESTEFLAKSRSKKAINFAQDM